MIIRRHITSNFTVIPNEALLDERLTIGARWLLCYLLSRPQDWQVQIADIQKKAAVGRDKAYALVKELITIGWVRKDAARDDDGRWGGVEYVVMDEPEASDQPLPENPKAVEPIAANPQLTKDGPLPKTERTKFSSEGTLAEEFEEFWAAYPKRQNNPKQPALRKYITARLSLHTSHETLVNAVKRYAASRAGQDPTYTAMAATWLNQRRWEEYSGEEAWDVGRTATDVVEAVKGMTAHYPGIVDSGATEEAAAIIRSGSGTAAQLVEAAEKFKLWVKLQKAEGLNPSVGPLSTWLKFRWRHMDNYVFCYRGMTNRKSVKLRKGSTSDEDSARIAG